MLNLISSLYINHIEVAFIGIKRMGMKNKNKRNALFTYIPMYMHTYTHS